MFYEMIIEKKLSTEQISRTIWIEESSTFEQLQQQVSEALQEAAPKNHSFQIICSNGKKQAGITIQPQSSDKKADEAPFSYDDDSTRLFADCFYEKDVLLKNYFKKTGDSATYVFGKNNPSEYTITLNKILTPEATILAKLEQLMDLSPELGEDADNLKGQLTSLTRLLIKSTEKPKKRPTPKHAQIYSFKITLENVGVPVWRKVQVRSDSTFLELHKIIQILFD